MKRAIQLVSLVVLLAPHPSWAQAGVSVSGRVEGLDLLPPPVVSFDNQLDTHWHVVLVGTPVGNIDTSLRDDGSFEFRQVPAGKYTLRLVRAPLMVRPVTVEVEARDVRGVVLPVRKTRQFIVRYALDDGGKAPLFSLAARDPADNTLVTERAPNVASNWDPFPGTGASFLYMTLPEGEYRVRVQSLPEQFGVKSIRYGAVDLLRDPLRVSAGDSDEIRITLGRKDAVKVSGRLIYSDSSPAAPADVTLQLQQSRGTPQVPNVTTRSNPDGSFEFPSVSAGTYSLMTASATETKTIVVGGQEVSGIVLAITAAVRLTVRTEVEGATEARVSPILHFSGKSNIQFQAPNTAVSLLEGAYRVSAERIPEFYTLKSVTYGGVNMLETPANITFGGAREIVMTFVPLAKGIRISGHVNGVENLDRTETRRVTLSADGVVRSAMLQSDGSFVFRDIPSGRFRLRAEPSANSTSSDLILTTQDVDNADLTVDAATPFLFRVVVPQGYPLPGPDISLIPAGRAKPPITATAATALGVPLMQGLEVIFRGLVAPEYRRSRRFAPGDYWVYVSARGYTVSALTDGTSDLLKVPLNLTATSRPMVVLTLEPAPGRWFKVQGTVSRSQPEDPAATWATLETITGWLLKAPVAADGSFEFPHVPADAYMIRAIAGDSVPPISAGGFSPMNPNRVIVQDADVRDLVVPGPALKPSNGGQEDPTVPASLVNFLNGVVRVAGNAVAPRVRIGFTRTSPVQPSAPRGFAGGFGAASLGGGRPIQLLAQSDGAGRFRLALPGGQEISVGIISGPPSGYRVQSIVYTPKDAPASEAVDLLNARLRLDDPRKTGEVVVTLEPAAGFTPVNATGRVSGPAAVFLAGRTLTIRGNDTGPEYQTTLNPDGVFRFEGILPGRYEATLPDLFGAQSQGLSIAGSDSAGIEIAFPPLTVVKGRVAIEGGGEIARMFLEFIRPVSASSDVRSVAELAVHSEQTFNLGIPAGAYFVRVGPIPDTYVVKSIKAGLQDLFVEPLNVFEDRAAEVLVTLGRAE